MPTTEQYLRQLQQDKEKLKGYLADTGVEVTDDDNFTTLAPKVSEVLDANTKDATATANDIILNKTAYANGQKVIGTLEIIDGNEVAY